MANKEIKQTIRLEGEQEYNAALRAAQRNLKTLRSELKAETAELGANATAQQKNETRARSLQKQIAEQEKVVETLRKALDEAKANYGDNEVVVAQWEQRLNNARATLGNMRNELDTLGQSFGEVHEQTAAGVVATKSFADAVESIASVGDSVSTAIENIFTGMVDTVRDIVTDLWDLISETAARADNYTDVAGYWNTDPAKIQQWSNALSACDKDLASFQHIVTRLNLGGKDKEIAEMLGISSVNYEDQWEYAIAVMNRLNELQKGEGVPDNFWEKVFGEKKSLEAMEIVNAWDSILDKLALYDADNGGIGLTSEGIEKYAQIHEEIHKAQTSWDALKDSVAEGFADVTLNIMANVNGALEALNDILKADTAEEREEAVKKLEQNLTELFGKVADAIKAGVETLSTVGEELANSDDPVVSAIGKILKDLTDAFQWLVDHQDAVKTALETIFGVWLVGRLASIAGKLTSIIAQIETIKAFSLINGTGAAAGAAGAGAGGAGAAGAGAAAGGGGLVGAGLLAGIGLLFAKATEYRQKYGARGSVEAIDNAAEGNDELKDAFSDFIKTQGELEEAMMNAGTVSDEEADRLAEQADEAAKRFYSFDEAGNMMHTYSDWRQENGLGNMDWVMPDSMFGSRDEVADEVAGVTSSVDDVGTKIDATKDEVVRVARENARWYASHVGTLRVVLDGQVVGRVVGAGIAHDAVE